jgi:uncharacterized membrane-anchored protein
MTGKELALVKKIIADTALYFQKDAEGIRLHYLEDNYFVGEGDETGEEYWIEYTDVDLKNDMFYKVVLMDLGDYNVE